MISKCPDKDTNQPVSYLCISSVQFSRSVMSDSLRPHELQHARPPCLSPTLGVYSNSWQTQTHGIESVMPSSHLILCCPLLLLPPIPPSIRVFTNESTLRMRWPKYWSFSFSISPSNEHPGLISFRMDWLGLLTVQGTLKSLLQHHSSKASILQRFPLLFANSDGTSCHDLGFFECGVLSQLFHSPDTYMWWYK